MSAVIGIFETLYKKKKPLTVVLPGTQKRDFTHIDDIVKDVILHGKKVNKMTTCLVQKEVIQ
jgi:UDP-glucose 4-epimerase